jgi:glutamyl-tRNA(Gln) amidotransferase subunit E
MAENPKTPAKPESFDPKSYGLKCGLEIHQQAGRPGDHKLFCSCPAEIIERQPDLVVERTLRASAGETGLLDIAAAAEQAKGKRYVYHAFNDATCLVELDEEPPHPVNDEVIKTAVMVAKACGSTILPKVQFMRKTIVDGSAVSGFQRTGLFALGGNLPEVNPPVRLQTIAVEEDAAKIVTKTPEADTYNISRLGIPLLEIATEPDIISPQHAQEAAAAIGMILRSTKRVKRGLGTIRQDVNVSIAGGARIEIKGCQDLRMIPTYIECEAKRQKTLLELRDLLKERLGDALTALPEQQLIDVTPIFSKSTTGFIKSAIAKGILLKLELKNAGVLQDTEKFWKCPT